LFILIALSWVYVAFGHVTWVAGLLYGIKPTVVAIVLHAAHRIGSRALKNKVLWAIAGASFVAIFALNLPFPLIVLGAAIIGYLGGRYAPKYFQIGGGHANAQKSYGAAIIDDDTPAPPYARFNGFRLFKILLTGAVLWCVPMGLLWQFYGWEHTYTQMAWFFTKAAWLTFGGAYAVLPYVYQGAVGQYGWLTPTQMVDGLALGETTPGPLIMVVAFVGFVGAYMPQQDFMTGAIAATLVTWFTFLPSFILILAGAPLVESTRSAIKLIAPLTTITAAVVGVILNLALFFAYHVLWPYGFSGAFDVMGAVIALCAAVALFKYKIGVIRVIAASAFVGLVFKALM
jgi:chromate transporter